MYFVESAVAWPSWTKLALIRLTRLPIGRGKRWLRPYCGTLKQLRWSPAKMALRPSLTLAVLNFGFDREMCCWVSLVFLQTEYSDPQIIWQPWGLAKVSYNPIVILTGHILYKKVLLGTKKNVILSNCHIIRCKILSGEPCSLNRRHGNTYFLVVFKGEMSFGGRFSFPFLCCLSLWQCKHNLLPHSTAVKSVIPHQSKVNIRYCHIIVPNRKFILKNIWSNIWWIKPLVYPLFTSCLPLVWEPKLVISSHKFLWVTSKTFNSTCRNDHIYYCPLDSYRQLYCIGVPAQTFLAKGVTVSSSEFVSLQFLLPFMKAGTFQSCSLFC